MADECLREYATLHYHNCHMIVIKLSDWLSRPGAGPRPSHPEVPEQRSVLHATQPARVSELHNLHDKPQRHNPADTETPRYHQ
jgi:hypothetical protein